MPKAAVPEKKVPEVIPPKPESPPPAGNVNANILERKIIAILARNFTCVNPTA